MKRWNEYLKTDVEQPDHGGFIVEPLQPGEKFEWLLAAAGNVRLPKPSDP